MNSTIMEQTRYWMWSRSKFNPRPPPPPLFFNSPTTTTTMVCPTVDSSWEEQAFAEDSAGLLGGCIWPPRSYSCSFCQREFRSAQALGGHMNVHRRDRARLKQSSSSSSSPTDDTTSDPILYPNPNPNPSPNFPSYSSPVFTDLYADDPQRHPGPPIAVRMAGGLELKLGVESWKVGREGKKEEEEDGVVINSNKRKRSIDDIGMFTSATTTNKKHFSEVIKVNPGHVEELDLELRLGDPPKVKY